MQAVRGATCSRQRAHRSLLLDSTCATALLTWPVTGATAAASRGPPAPPCSGKRPAAPPAAPCSTSPTAMPYKGPLHRAANAIRRECASSQPPSFCPTTAQQQTCMANGITWRSAVGATRQLGRRRARLCTPPALLSSGSASTAACRQVARGGRGQDIRGATILLLRCSRSCSLHAGQTRCSTGSKLKLVFTDNLTGLGTCVAALLRPPADESVAAAQACSLLAAPCANVDSPQ